MTLDELKTWYVRHVLAACGGDRREAARRLGCCPKTIYNVMARHERRPERQPRKPT